MKLQFILLPGILGICLGLKDVRIKLPKVVKKGDSAIFECSYDLEDETLYAVKWFKGDHEFYRYIPNNNPAIMIFPNRELTVNESASNITQVTLTGLELNSAGTYFCEVSTDAPTFHAAVVMATMHVIEIPRNQPSIHGVKDKYGAGDILLGNCTSDASKPAANLTWYINDREPLSSSVIHYDPEKSNVAGLWNSIVGLRFPITSEDLAGGVLRVECVASIYDVYLQSTGVSAKEGLLSNDQSATSLKSISQEKEEAEESSDQMEEGTTTETVICVL